MKRNLKFFGKIAAALLTGITACVFCGACHRNPNIEKPHPTAVITVKNYGVIKLELYQDVAPNTVANFISLAKAGFYDGLTFHRVIPDFMIQSGDPDGNGRGGPGYSIKGEFENNGYANSLKHETGVISMARYSNNMNSAGSQFFICTADSPHLDGDFAAFGKVTDGLEIAFAISKAERDSNDRPLSDIVIKSITVDEKGGDYSNVQKIKG